MNFEEEIKTAYKEVTENSDASSKHMDSELKKNKLECGPMSNVMVAHTEHRWRPLFNAAKFG